MNATLVTFPGISSFECLTASSLNKFSRSVEQTPELRYKLLLALHIYEEYVIAFIMESTIGL